MFIFLHFNAKISHKKVITFYLFRKSLIKIGPVFSKRMLNEHSRFSGRNLEYRKQNVNSILACLLFSLIKVLVYLYDSNFRLNYDLLTYPISYKKNCPITIVMEAWEGKNIKMIPTICWLTVYYCCGWQKHFNFSHSLVLCQIINFRLI